MGTVYDITGEAHYYREPVRTPPPKTYDRPGAHDFCPSVPDGVTATVECGRPVWSDGIHRDQIARTVRRIVSARRARKLRRRAEYVHFHSYTSAGAARYEWWATFSLGVCDQ